MILELSTRERRRLTFGRASAGMRIFIIGVAQKVLIADEVARIAEAVFDKVGQPSLLEAWLGLGAYTIQIYFDFAGYSNMAIGLGLALGFAFPRNFRLPYTASSITDFLRRWHISLSQWLRDYLYIPLGGSRGSTVETYRNLWLVFLLCGLWHGANWTFVLFGFLHGCFFIPLILRGTLNKKRKSTTLSAIPTAKELANMLFTYSLVVLSVVAFRSETVVDAMQYFQRMASPSLFSIPVVTRKGLAALTFALVFVLLILEWLNRDKPYAIQRLGLNWPRPIRWSFYYLGVLFMFFFAGLGQTFIYVQF